VLCNTLFGNILAGITTEDKERKRVGRQSYSKNKPQEIHESIVCSVAKRPYRPTKLRTPHPSLGSLYANKEVANFSSFFATTRTTLFVFARMSSLKQKRRGVQ
jgi:gluconate kinase